MKGTMLALAMFTSGCSYLQGLTAKSSEQECNEIISRATAQFCKSAADNRDKIKAAEEALK